MRVRALVVAALLLPSGGAGATTALPATSCTTCHGDPEWLGEDATELAGHFADDVHVGAGLSCHDCHGGNPDPALASDPTAAMDPDYAPAPFRGRPERPEIPGFCGRCHSDPTFMRRFRPDARVDAETEYRTSRHSELLARGDTGVATCVDCHGAHGILPVDDARAPVYPTHVAETCAHCHADAAHMAGRKTDDGRPLPVDQYAGWRRSVHAAGLLQRGDLSAPTCNDCHGNHGARPPGIDDLSFVCGQCHAREAALFRGSAKREAFRAHNEYLASVEGAGCVACHPAPEPPSRMTAMRHFSECATCHGNHLIVRPTVASLAPLPEAPCAFCHGPVGTGEAWAQEPPAIRAHFERTRAKLVGEAGDLDPEQRFDWLLGRIVKLPPHLRSESEGGGKLRSIFARLLARFRLGPIRFEATDAEGGAPVEVRVVRCTDCHAEGGAGAQVAGQIVEGMRQLTALSARAERVLTAARRGGVPVHGAFLEIDRAVDSQIELEVMVHSFHVEDGGAFREKQAEGVAHARTALEAGHAALGELASRRRGLGVALALIALVLVALAIKIRSRAAQPPRVD